MQWPILTGKSRLSATESVFGGYNHTRRVPEGEFYDMENLTSDHYPLLSPRKRRSVFLRAEDPGGLICKDSLCWTEGSCFVMNGSRVDLGLTEGKKQLVSMGAYVIILPDKKYINTADISDRGDLEARFTTQAPVTFTLCRVDGSEYTPQYTQPGEPQSPENMQLWVDTSGIPNTLKQWSQSAAMWITVATTYVKIQSPGIGKAFAEFDGVSIRGLSGDLTEDSSGTLIADPSELAALEGAAVIQARGEDYIVIPGMLEITRTVREPVTVSREMPAMDFVVERDNRLWGCRYGLSNDGQVVNEIYASKLGDFRNWNCYMGISSDSYAVSLGSDGPFTGAAVYGGYPLFFKENCVHKIFGDYPANFGIQTTACRGVQQGSGDSLAIANELLYYKSRHGVCVYDGAVPVEISAPLGDVRYEKAVAAGHGNKYYISMLESLSQKPVLFVYDTALGVWHREDSFRASALCSCTEDLYAIEEGSGVIWGMLGSGGKKESAVCWMAQTGPLGLDLPETKSVSKLVLRMALELGTRVQLFIQYDSLGPWIPLCTLAGQNLRSFAVPIRPRRCDHFRIRIRGEGEARIYSFTKTISQGSDRM